MTKKFVARLVVVTAIAAGIAYACTYFMPVLFQSQMVLLFPQTQASSMANPLFGTKGGGMDTTSMRGLGNAFFSPLVGSGEQTAMGILQSRTCTSAMVAKFGFDKKWKLPKQKAIEELESRISVKQEKSGFVSVSANMESPKLSVDVVNAMFSHLVERSEQLTVSISQRNRKFVENQLASATKELEAKTTALEAKMAESPLANTEELVKVYFDAQKNLQIAKSKEAAAKSTLNALDQSLADAVAAASGMPSMALATSGDDKAYAALITELQSRRQALADAKRTYTKQSPEFRAAERAVSSIEEVTTQITDRQKAFVERGLTPLQIQARTELAGLSGEIDAFAGVLTEYESKLKMAPKQFADVEKTKAEFQGALTRVATLTGELDIARIAESRDPSRFEVVDNPAENPFPVSPRRVRITLIAAVLVLLVQLWPMFARRISAAESARS